MADVYREPIEEQPTPAETAGESAGSLEKAPVQPEAEKVSEKVAAPFVVSTSVPTPPPKVSYSRTAIKAETERLRGFEKNQQLKALVDLAFEKGVYYATEVVKNMDNPYILDEFHDVLVDELHKTLVERGKLEEI